MFMFMDKKPQMTSMVSKMVKTRRADLTTGLGLECVDARFRCFFLASMATYRYIHWFVGLDWLWYSLRCSSWCGKMLGLHGGPYIAHDMSTWSRSRK